MAHLVGCGKENRNPIDRSSHPWCFVQSELFRPNGAAEVSCAGLPVIQRRFFDAVSASEFQASGSIRLREQMSSDSAVRTSRRSWAIGLLFFLALAPALAAGIPSRSTPSSSVTKPGLIKPEVVCPSNVFDEFLSAFSEHADLQRRYTRLPLQYGEYADLAGNRIEWRHIQKMKDIPQFVRETGLVFRSKSQRADKGLDLKIESGVDERLRETLIFQADGGYKIRYYFYLAEDCWHLYAIKNAYY
jgi:hypothetical protein